MAQQPSQYPPNQEAGAARGRLLLRLRSRNGRPVRARTVALLAEHKPVGAAQHRLDADDQDELSADLEPGGYSIQVFAVGYQVARQFARIEAGKTTEVDVTLVRKEGEWVKPTPEQRLRAYGLSPDKLDLRDLTVRPGEYVELDARRYPDQRAFTRLYARSVKDLKAWLGAPADMFGHDEPIFGALPALDRISAEAIKDPDRLAPEVRTTLAAAAREYISGNARSVAKVEGLLNDQFVSRYPEGLLVSIFHMATVTIGPNATLEIGGSTSVFFANRLRIHQTGTLSVIGTVKADIGTYEEFV